LNEIYEIKTNKKPMIPTSLVQLQEALENITDEIYINIPQISDYILELPPLPEPTWDIFV
ncbi:26125_t:CDS:2, partial [Racocetra persica]